MEEVDKIILDSLKNINCDLGDVNSLEDFDSYLMVLAVASCLEAILQTSGLPKKLPPTMNAKMKMASVLADHISKLGYYGDMGYSSILYSSVLEMRKILIFLIEKLPRDPLKLSETIETSYILSVLKEVDGNLQFHLKNMWIPSNLLNYGFRKHKNNNFIKHSFGDSIPLIPASFTNFPIGGQNREVAKYLDHIVMEVPKQCSTKHVISTVLFKDCYFPDNFEIVENGHQQKENIDQKENNQIMHVLETAIKVIPKNESIHQNETEKLSSDLNEIKQKYLGLKEDVQVIEMESIKIENTKNNEQIILKDILADLKLRNKTLGVLSKDENVEKLQSLIRNANQRLNELTIQYKRMKHPLLEEYKKLQDNLSVIQNAHQEEINKLVKLREVYNNLTNYLKGKTMLESVLIQKCQQMPKGDKRFSYTRRIYEIIGNINKQNYEIQKILEDTRTLQKEIKILIEQIDRSFTSADELIFHDCKQEETARKSYKLLVSLRDEFTIILKAVSDVGQIERECRNLQEQIDTENSKGIAEKLERVNADLLQIQKETTNIHNNTSDV